MQQAAWSPIRGVAAESFVIAPAGQRARRAGRPRGRYNHRVIVERIPFLSGNEAIARGAARAGLGFACGYPGTPSTEIVEELARLDGPLVEWCINEKVALETGIGASLAGARTVVTMKHVGLNVAADPFMTLALTGVNAGLVVVSANKRCIRQRERNP